MDKKQITATLLAVVTTTIVQAQIMRSAPRLVVGISVENLSTDGLEKYAAIYGDGGFRRLLHEGKVFRHAKYPFVPVDKTSAIAAIMTGTTPYYNGVVGKRWLDRNTLRPVLTVDDSPESIQTSTISDELKVCSGGRAIVYSIANDSETAILSAGHSADAALWLSGSGGRWQHSAYYSTQAPKWVSAYNKAVVPNAALTPNDQVTRMALRCIESNGMGGDDISDLLLVAYETNDSEAEYLDVDKNIGELIASVEDRVGKDKVMFFVTGTGYSANGGFVDYGKYRVPTGTFYVNRTANLLNMYLGAIYGQGKYVESSFRNQLYLNTKLIEQRCLSVGDILSRSQEFLMQISGVRNVFTRESLINANAANSQIRNGFNFSISGDILIEIAPGWTLHNEDTQEKYQNNNNFVPFPVIFYGNGIESESVNTPVYIDCIAPAVAGNMRIRAPNACHSEPLF